MFVGITQDKTNDGASTANVVAGSVRHSDYNITIGGGMAYSSEEFELNPLITRLSSTTFAISYYCKENALCTRYGSVNVKDLSVQLSNVTVFSNNTMNSTQAEIVGMSEAQYLLVYYDSGGNNLTYSGPLTVTVANVPLANGGDGTLAAPVLGKPSTLITTQVSFYFKAARLSDSVAVVAYADPSINYGLKVQAVKISEPEDFSATSSAGESCSACLLYIMVKHQKVEPQILFFLFQFSAHHGQQAQGGHYKHYRLIFLWILTLLPSPIPGLF